MLQKMKNATYFHYGDAIGGKKGKLLNFRTADRRHVENRILTVSQQYNSRQIFHKEAKCDGGTNN